MKRKEHNSMTNKGALVMRHVLLALCGSAVCTGLVARAASIDLGAAATFAIISAAGVTSTGATVINGDVGLSPLTTLTGSPEVNGVIYANDAVAVQARADARAAYDTIVLLQVYTDLTGQDLGGMVLAPGVYHFDTSAQLTGTLTLDGQGQANPQFVFQIGSTLTTASSAAIWAINGAVDWNVYFQVGSSATLGTGTDFIGTLLSDQSNTLNAGTTVRGGVFALEGAVVLDGNTIDAVPEPATAGLLVVAMAFLLTVRRNLGKSGRRVARIEADL